MCVFHVFLKQYLLKVQIFWLNGIFLIFSKKVFEVEEFILLKHWMVVIVISQVVCVSNFECTGKNFQLHNGDRVCSWKINDSIFSTRNHKGKTKLKLLFSIQVPLLSGTNTLILKISVVNWVQNLWNFLQQLAQSLPTVRN